MDLCLPMTISFSSGLILSAEDCLSTPDEIDEMKNTPFHKALELLI